MQTLTNDGTYNHRLQPVTFKDGYQVSTGAGRNSLTIWMRLLAFILPNTFIGRYTYSNGDTVYELSMWIGNETKAREIGVKHGQESIYSWKWNELIYLQGK